MDAEEPDGLRFRASGNVAASDMGDELAILNFGTDTYFTLNATGAFVWHQLATPTSLSELASRVALEFGVDDRVAAHDVKELLDELVRVGLVEKDVGA